MSDPRQSGDLHIHESMTVDGQFELGGEVRWTSFREMFVEPGTETQEAQD